MCGHVCECEGGGGGENKKNMADSGHRWERGVGLHLLCIHYIQYVHCPVGISPTICKEK